jgi:hypothetical protein
MTAARLASAPPPVSDPNAEPHGALAELGPFLIERWLRDLSPAGGGSKQEPFALFLLAMADLTALRDRAGLTADEAWSWARSGASAFALDPRNGPAPLARHLLRLHNSIASESTRVCDIFWSWMREGERFCASNRIDGLREDAGTLAIRHRADWVEEAVAKTPKERWNTDWLAETRLLGVNAEHLANFLRAKEERLFGGKKGAAAARQARAEGFLGRILQGPRGMRKNPPSEIHGEHQELLASWLRDGFALPAEIGQWLTSDDGVLSESGKDGRPVCPLRIFAAPAGDRRGKPEPSGLWGLLLDAGALDLGACPRSEQKRLPVAQWALLLRNAEMAEAIARHKPEAFGVRLDALAALLSEPSMGAFSYELPDQSRRSVERSVRDDQAAFGGFADGPLRAAADRAALARVASEPKTASDGASPSRAPRAAAKKAGARGASDRAATEAPVVSAKRSTRRI